MAGLTAEGIGKSIRQSQDPIKKGKEILLEEYRKYRKEPDSETGSALFEMARSRVHQNIYECTSGTKWLDQLVLAEEIEDAKAERERYSENVMQTASGKINAVLQFNDHTRFVGSIRQYLPGVGYAVSVRKRKSHNQDSFSMQEGLLAVADGLGSFPFSSIASMRTLMRLNERRSELAKNPASELEEVSGEIRQLLNDGTSGEGYAGCTTLTLAMIEGEKKKIIKLGDSLPFWSYDNCTSRKLEKFGHRVLLSVIGQNEPIEGIEQYEKSGGALILTSDGVTDFIHNAFGYLENMVNLISDPVLLAENIIRTVMRNRIHMNYSDDATIIVEEQHE